MNNFHSHINTINAAFIFPDRPYFCMKTPCLIRHYFSITCLVSKSVTAITSAYNIVGSPVRWFVTQRTQVSHKSTIFVPLHIYRKVILTIPVNIKTDIPLIYFCPRVIRISHPCNNRKTCVILSVHNSFSLRPCINSHKEHYKETNKPFHIHNCLIIHHPKDSPV